MSSMNFIKLTEQKLDVNEISERVADESCGAISLFVGITRDNFEDKKVISLKYEAYDKMANKTLAKICDDIREKWPDVRHIALYHRLGEVPIKESSVVIAISSPHRQDSLEAVQFAIDELKRTVPIWKKEIYGGAHEDTDSIPRKRVKRTSSQLNFDLCCPVKNEIIVPKDLQQIRVDDTEIRRRIDCFINRKRDEINSNNVNDFITPKMDVDNVDSSCARVRSTVYRIKDTKSHLKIHRVKNETGPQTTNYKMALDKLMENAPATVKIKADPDGGTASDNNKSLSIGIQERLDNIEQFLHIPTNEMTTKHLLQRLKQIEDKILYLETMSPEYTHFLNKPTQANGNGLSSITVKKEQKKKYSVQELDDLLHKFQK